MLQEGKYPLTKQNTEFLEALIESLKSTKINPAPPGHRYLRDSQTRKITALDPLGVLASICCTHPKRYFGRALKSVDDISDGHGELSASHSFPEVGLNSWTPPPNLLRARPKTVEELVELVANHEVESLFSVRTWEAIWDIVPFMDFQAMSDFIQMAMDRYSVEKAEDKVEDDAAVASE